MKVLSLPTHAHPRIVAALEDLLDRARAGKVKGLFCFVEDEDGNVSRVNDGFSDVQLIFSLELVKKRLLGQYE